MVKRYEYVYYSQSPADKEILLAARVLITERVVDITQVGPDQVVELQRDCELLSNDDPDTLKPRCGDPLFWYIIHNGDLYLTKLEPDMSALFDNSHTGLWLDLPLAEGKAWCVSGPLRQVNGMPMCEYGVPRVVRSVAPYRVGATTYEQCYEVVDPATSGDLVTWFCDGVGVVADSYDHGGTRFGHRTTLVEVKP